MPRRFLAGVLLSVAVLAMSLARSADAATLTPSATTIQVGDTFDITLDFTASDIIGAIDLVVDSNAALVTRTGATDGALLAGLPFFLDITPSFAPSASRYSRSILFPGDQTGPAQFLVLTYVATSVGTAQFNLFSRASNSIATDEFAVNASTSVLVEASPIPLPASMLLLTGAFGGLAAMRRASRKTRPE